MDVEDSSINIVRTGPRGRPPVSFIHAVGLDLTWCDHRFGALGGAHDLVEFDLSGHGRSERIAGRFTFDALASVAAEVVASVEADSAHVVGIRSAA